MNWFVPIQRLYRKRRLIASFLRQDLKQKYHGSYLGFAWSLINPLLMMAILATAFAFVFHRDYPLHLFATLLPWRFFSTAINQGCRSVTSSERLIRQWDIPLFLFPLRRTLAGFFEFLFAMCALFFVVGFIGFRPSIALLVLPLSLFYIFLFVLGITAILSVTSVYLRDIDHVTDIGLRALFYLSPIIVPFEQLPAQYQWWMKLNPLYYFLEMFDAPIARAVWPDPAVMGIAGLLATFTWASGMLLYARVERNLIVHI